MSKITVLLPVKNGEKFLTECIDSILNQSFNDFELLVFDDNSSDQTVEILNSYSDNRIQLFTGTSGYIYNLNRGIEIANGEYIARMDADDIMDPLRLEIQLHRMENLAIDLCGSWIKIFGEGVVPYVLERPSGFIDYPLYKLTEGNFIPHPSVMLRKQFLIKNNLRYEHYPHAEDYKLWVEIAKRKGIFYIEPKALLAYRMSTEQVTAVHEEAVKAQTWLIYTEIIDYLQQIHH